MTDTFLAIDTLFAHNLLSQGPKEAHHFLSTLFKNSREGKLFVNVTGIALPKEINDLTQRSPSPLVIEGDRCYLRRNYDLEESLAKDLAKIISSPKALQAKPIPPKSLYPAQIKAFSAIFENRLVIVTGGPGSGKTHLANATIEALIKQNPDAKIIATAPTGKAAFRIKHPRAITKTLHSLLNLRQASSYAKSMRPIICDLLIVDEGSMIDIKLFKLLFESLLPHTHIVLMGDPDQLPPVEAGPIFTHLCKIESIPIINLNLVKRTDIASLTHLASCIRQSDIEGALHILSDPNSRAQIKPIPASPPIIKDEKSAIITPFKKGQFGTDACNKAHKHLDRCPIMITKNDYKLSLMNGDIGQLENSTVTFDLGDQTKSYPLALLSHYTYAFAISIHKSQGSEFDHVHLILPPSDTPHTKEMVYTAVTRAKKTLTIYASQDTISQALQNKESAPSNIEKRVQNFMATLISN